MKKAILHILLMIPALALAQSEPSDSISLKANTTSQCCHARQPLGGAFGLKGACCPLRGDFVWF